MTNIRRKKPAVLRSNQRSLGAIMGNIALVGVIMTIGLVALFNWLPTLRSNGVAKAASYVQVIPLGALSKPLPAIEEHDPEEEVRKRQLALTPLVRKQLCRNYGRRYHRAKTAVQLSRAIQLSQATGCGWESILQADARTHNLSPEALAVALSIEADNPDPATVAGTPHGRTAGEINSPAPQ